MAVGDYPNSATLWPPKKKSENPNAPVLSGFGEVTIPRDMRAGEILELDLAAWKKTSRDGSKNFMSLSVKEKEDRERPGAPAKTEKPAAPDDDIPF